MISKRHITARGNATTASNPLMRGSILAKIGQSTMIKRVVLDKASCHMSCDIKASS